MKDTYYLLGYTVCREIVRDGQFKTEYYKIGAGWVEDKPGEDYRNLHGSIHAAKFGFDDMSVMDLNTLTEEKAKVIAAKQEELGREDIPGLHWGGAYRP